jgi:protein HOOK3
MLKESRLGQNTGNFDEAVTSLKAELQMREDEIEKLQVSYHYQIDFLVIRKY